MLSESKLFSEKELVSTPVPMINVALSGSVDGGLASGLTVLAGPSKHFKTSFALLMAASYLKKHDDSVLLFYDSEFGSPQSYFESFGVDTSRVLHTPVTNIEELKFDLVHQLGEIERKDKVIVVIDSIGNIASKKEVEDAENMKSVADMTRAKALKGLFRMITPMLTLNDIPLLAINHTYQCGTKEMTVQTPDGNVSLADIKIGDTVLTEEGWEEVTFTTSHEDSDITEITLEDGEVLSFTEGHRFKVNGEWKYLNELMPGDVLDDILNKMRKIKSIEYAKRKATVYDFETPSHTYVLGSGIISHNTQEMFSKAVVSGGCVVEGTLIQTADGLKAVEDFNVGEKVITLDGEKEVTHVWNPDTLDEGTPECYEIEFEDGHTVTCSDKHKFLIDGEWVEAKDLIVGQDCQII